MRKLVALVAGLSSAALFAAGEDNATNVFENVQSAANAVKDGVGNAANAAAPVIVTVIGIGVALWIIPTIVGVVKRAFGAGKGR